MDRRSVDWQGPITAIVTPFDADGRINEAAFRQVVEQQIRAGVTGIVVAGCTGEFWSLSAAERKQLYALAVNAVAGRVPVIAGTGAVGTPETIELTAHAKAVGCAGAMILPPYFVKLAPEDIIAHYAAVAERVKFPVMVYNIPANNLNAVTPELADRLADIETVVAIKESSFDYRTLSRTIAKVKDRVLVFGPYSTFGYAAHIMGAAGSVGILHHVWGRGPTDLHDACARGDVAAAAELQRTAGALLDLLGGNGRNVYSALKAAMTLVGNPGGLPRAPLKPLAAHHVEELAAGLAALGITVSRAIKAA